MNSLLKSSRQFHRKNILSLNYRSISIAKLPIIATNNPNDDAFDSVVIVGADLDDNILNNQSLNQYKGLKVYKDVFIIN